MIRRARTEDAEALAALQVRAWWAAYSSYVAAEDLAAVDDVAARAAGWRDRLREAREDRVTLVAGERVLVALGHRAATLWTFAANEPARRFYERGGWRVDERPYDPGRWGWAPSVRYRKELIPAAARR